MRDFSRYTEEELKKLLDAIDTIHFFGVSTVETRQAVKRELEERAQKAGFKSP